jgi:hypothetical protein
LELWQAVEFSDVEGARHLVAPSALAEQSSTGFARMVESIGDNVPGLKILDTNRFGLDASVRAYLVFYAAGGNVSAFSPMTFQFHRSSSQYQLSDLSYFVRRAQEIRRSLRHRPPQQ